MAKNKSAEEIKAEQEKKAAEEARLKAEEEAKLKAEQEKKAAEEEARLKAEGNITGTEEANKSGGYVTDKTQNESGEIALTQENIGEKEKIKPKPVEKDEPQGIFSKVYQSEHGATKHYLKFKRAQVEVENPLKKGNLIIIFADDPERNECPYFENLPDSDIAKYKPFDIAKQ